jgi:Fe-S oxidoreductase
VECPSAVDMAKIKYEFLNYYYKTANHRRRIRDYIFGHIDSIARNTYPIASLINVLLNNRIVKIIGESFFGITRYRNLPKFSTNPFRIEKNTNENNENHETVLVLLDAFNKNFYPENIETAVRLLDKLGYCVQIIPITGAGRTLLSKGFLAYARKHAIKLIDMIYEMDPMGISPIIGIEPSEIYTFRDEIPDLLPTDDRVRLIKERVFMIDEFLVRPDSEGIIRIAKLIDSDILQYNHRKTVILHGHCYQKAQSPALDGFPLGVSATISMLEQAGYHVSIIDDGCCGMAGAFGYESDHYTLSMRIGELALFPAVREAIRIYGNDVIISASGVSCKAQIEDGTGAIAIHPIRLINFV